MSFFGDEEIDEPVSRGLLGRLKLRVGFTGGSSAAIPIVGAEPKFDPGAEVSRERPKQASGRTERAVNAIPVTATAQPMTLGMRLRNGGDVTDVDVHDAMGDGWTATVDDQRMRVDEGIDSPSVDHRDDVLVGEVRDLDAELRQVQSQKREIEPELTIAAAGDTNATTPGSHLFVEAPVRSAGVDRPSLTTDIVASEVLITPSGLPRLVSADALPSYKRILCDGSSDAPLRITNNARRQFIAVELQAGVAIVVATHEFHETAMYSTYIKDLARADIAVREEMVATEDIIAAVYAAEKTRTTGSAPEASRAIGVFRDVMEAANAYGAGDVHWEYRDFKDEVEVRFRVNGDLYTYRHMPKALVRKSLSAAYQDLVQRNTNSGESFQPSIEQSAMIPLVAQKDMLNIRWQGIPNVGGFDVLLRLLDGNFRNYKVLLPEQMGLEASQLEILGTLGHVSGGVSIFTGETGSAKSTLLRALSYLLASRDLAKQYAVNEPSEYPQPWLTDISIQRRPDETDAEASRKCAQVIRSLMRGDPDDITVGEIRDSVVAGLVAELALTGHPVRTTLHADSAIGAFMRLAGGRLQLPMDEVSSEKFVNAVGNQKLIPLLCPHCKLPAEDVMPKQQLELLRTKFGLDTSKMACRDEAGCEQCRLPGLFTRAGKIAAGTKKQTLVMELFRPTDEFLERVSQRDWRGAEKVWRSQRATGFDDPDMTGKTIVEHALYKASTGVIDPRFINLSMRSFAEYRIFADRDGRMPS